MAVLLSSWIIFLVIGRVFIYLWQQFPLPQPIERFKTIQKLHLCDLCAGVWIYGLLSFFMGLSLLQVLGFSYIPVVSEVITGGVTSFIMWIFVAGWKDKFQDTLVV